MPLLKDIAKRWHYMQMLFMIWQAEQIQSWSRLCSPRQLPKATPLNQASNEISRAAVRAPLCTAAVEMYSNNSEASICCPGGWETNPVFQTVQLNPLSTSLLLWAQHSEEGDGTSRAVQVECNFIYALRVFAATSHLVVSVERPLQTYNPFAVIKSAGSWGREYTHM